MRLGELAALPAAIGASPTDDGPAERPRRELNPKADALVQVAALIAVGSSCVCHRRVVRRALDSGATADDVLGTMTATAPIVGVGRLVSAVPKIALALGYDVDAAFEQLDAP